MMNEDFYQSLPADLQQVVDRGGRLAQESMRGANCANEELALQALQDSDMEVYIPTAEEKETFKEAAQEPVLEWLRGEIGSDYADEFMAAVEGVKKGEGILTSEEKVMEQQQTGFRHTGEYDRCGSLHRSGILCTVWYFYSCENEEKG